MMHDLQEDTHHWLVPISPELLVSVRPEATPVIEAIAPQVASWTGRSADELVGHSLPDVFDDTIPGLAVVVEEVFVAGTPVRDYRMTFRDHTGVERTIVLQAALRPGRPDAQQKTVALRLEEIPAGERLAETVREVQEFHGLIGRSPALLKIFRKVEIYGPTEAPVLITGETGTGKELAAHALHECSRRQHKPFVAVNCSAISAELLESELFGHERGAFTGASRAHKGRFERAHEGTLFLDEIGEMPLAAQAKFLRVLEEGMIERVGGERALAVDIRLVTATNIPLELAVQAKKFRLDLYHRLAVLRLHMPSLSERLEDIPVLVEHFLQVFNHKYHRHIRRLTPDAIALLQSHSWPGNVRELRNVLERVYIETSADVIGRNAFEEWMQERSQFFPGAWNLEARQASLAARPALIPPYPAEPRTPRPLLPYFRDQMPPIDVEPIPATELHGETWESPQPLVNVSHRGLTELTRERITQAYRQTAGNITQAARYLGVHKATLYRKMKALGLTRETLEAPHASASHVCICTDDDRGGAHAQGS